MTNRPNPHRTSRRRFLKTTAAVSTAAWVGNSTAASALTANRSANERLRFACIGVGGKGASDTKQASLFGDIVGICDIDDTRLNDMAGNFPKAKKYNDFRKMLEEIGKDVDGVTVSTPDHTHAVAAMMAIKMGKAVYVQKPLTHSVHEARALREAAQAHKVVTQMGNQGSAEDGLRTAVEFIQGGLIGNVTEVHVWTNRPVWDQAPKITTR
ncbi:MAG: Gfo/Idh/MocA family oxidoreductase, partial [Planctomycetales bacterium]